MTTFFLLKCFFINLNIKLKLNFVDLNDFFFLKEMNFFQDIDYQGLKSPAPVMGLPIKLSNSDNKIKKSQKEELKNLFVNLMKLKFLAKVGPHH